MNVLVLFGGKDYEATTERTVATAGKFGVDEVLVFDDVWLDAHPFRQVNRWIFETSWRRGHGWFSWKPLIIEAAFERFSSPHDVVLYLDADTYPVADLSVVFDTARRDGAMLFDVVGQKQRTWCKRDCFLVMAQDEARYHDAAAGSAQFAAFWGFEWRTRQLLLEWQAYSLNPRANILSPSVLGAELPGFREHRAEQAILTNLAHKFEFPLHRQACGAGEGWAHDRELYPQLFVQVPSTKEPGVSAGSRFRNV